MPEVLDFNRVNYTPLWFEGIEEDENRNSGHAIMNKVYMVQSQPDNAEYIHTTNLYGFRDSQWQVSGKGKYRILFVGDSNVEGLMTSDHETIPRFFNKLATANNRNTEVLNLGVSAAGIEEYTRLARDAARLLDPDEIILVLYANDFYLITPFLNTGIAEGNNSQSNKRPEPNNPFVPRIVRVITDLANGRDVALSWHEGPVNFFKPVPHPSNPWTRNGKELSDYVDANIARAMKAGTFNPFLVNRSNKILKIRNTVDSDIKDYLIYIHDLLMKNNISLSVVYLPDAEMISDYYTAYRQTYNKSGNIPSMTGQEYQVHAVYLDKLLGQLGIPFLDLTDLMKDQEDKGIRLFWEYDMHLRPAGYKIIAGYIYEWWKAVDANPDRSVITVDYIDGFDPWYIYTNQNQSGNPVTMKLDPDGDLNVHMKKTADPVRTDLPYPYAGIGLNFNDGNTARDFSKAKSLTLSYALSGSMSLLLPQKDIKPGEEFRIDLEEHNDFECFTVSKEDFHQPSWVKKPVTFDMSKITGVKFQITSPQRSYSELELRFLVFSEAGAGKHRSCIPD